jgi:hypothetical protein
VSASQCPEKKQDNADNNLTADEFKLIHVLWCRGSAVPGLRNSKQRDANSTTMMLIVVISLFLVVEIPLMVITALHTISSRCLA